MILTLDDYTALELDDYNTVAGENTCNKAVWLTNKKDIQDHLEAARKEPRFLLYDDSRVEALKRFCRENG